MTRKEAIAARYRTLVTRDWPALESEGVTTTFSLYRRVATSTKSDLGMKPLQWDPVTDAQDLPCVVLGNDGGDVRWNLDPQGNRISEKIVLHVAYNDVREGDELLLQLDSKRYLVTASIPQGPIFKILLDSGRSQSG